MSRREDGGPGGLPSFELGSVVADLGFGRTDFSEACRCLPDVSAFVDVHFEGPDAPSLCVVLDEPSRTATRSAVVLALADELSCRGRSVVVIDGDDHLPDLTRWSGQLEQEGWIDVVRYDLSLEAASSVLPLGDGTARLLGVGSYQPTRATAEELHRLLEFLGETVEHVIVCASTGDRGAVWAALPSFRVVCWDPVNQLSVNVENMIRDAGLLGESPRAVLAFAVGASQVAGPPIFRLDDGSVDKTVVKGSSAVFRRLAILMGILVIVLAIWWVGQTDWRGENPAETSGDDLVVVLDSTSVHDDGIPVEVVAAQNDSLGDQSETSPGTLVVDDPVDAPAENPPAPTITHAAAADTPSSAGESSIDDPFGAEVGAAGWCLWVYSLADDRLAEEELARMEGRGFHAVVHTAVVDDRNWHRIYTGSFATLSEANAAMTELYTRLETDWALPQRAGVLR